VKLSTRLTILLIAITTLVALLVGSFAVATSSRAQYAQLDNSINSVAASGNGNPLTALAKALNYVQQHNLNLTLDVIDPSDSVTQVATSDVPLARKPTLRDVRGSLTGIHASANLPGFRYRSIPVGGGSYLLIAGSTKSVSTSIHNLVVHTIQVGVLAALAMGIVARLFMRRDLHAIDQLVNFAKEVAGGDIQRDVPPPAGGSDVRELQTALAQMVDSLRSTIEAEQRSASTMQRFIGDASHELRTPLTVVKGYAELLARTDVAGPQREKALARVQKEVGRMDLLVSDLLFLAEVREVRTHDDTVIDVSEATTAAARDFSADHPGRDVSVSIEPGRHVAGNPDYLERLLSNVFSNIARHTGEHDPVRVTLRGEPGRVALCIEDGGPGMPDDSYGTRPEQFQRFDPSRSRASGGSGLGMSIMADVAASMGGTLTTAKSQLGGLSLNFSFPAAAAPT
jgi:two-component system, OmpR family, sensor kinase